MNINEFNQFHEKSNYTVVIRGKICTVTASMPTEMYISLPEVFCS